MNDVFIPGCQLLTFWTDCSGLLPALMICYGNLIKHRSVSRRVCQNQSAMLKKNTFYFKSIRFYFGFKSFSNVATFTAACHQREIKMVCSQPFIFLFWINSLWADSWKTKQWFQSSPVCKNVKLWTHLKYIDDNVEFKVKPAWFHFHLGHHFVTYLGPLSTSRM